MHPFKYFVPIAVLCACSKPAPPIAEAPLAQVAPPSPVEEVPKVAKEALAPVKPPELFDEPSLNDEWNSLLRYVTDDGGFRYQDLSENKEHRDLLKKLVEDIGSAEVSKRPKQTKLAHYINAYNILTVASVVNAWPIESVMKVDGFFDKTKHVVGGKEMTLNGLENEVIRGEEFSEPRIHFAVNCASTGCPWLHNKAMDGETLEETLELLTKNFVTRTTVINRRRKQAQVSKIFEWFKDDFMRDDNSVRGFLAKYVKTEDSTFLENKRTKIGYFEYDWALNAR